MGDNEEAAEGLTSHTRQLSDMLQRFENGSVDQNKGELTALISNLQRFAGILSAWGTDAHVNLPGSFKKFNRGSRS